MKIALVYPHSNMQFRPPRLYDALAMVNYELATLLSQRYSNKISWLALLGICGPGTLSVSS
jgi:hypothetical protein